MNVHGTACCKSVRASRWRRGALGGAVFTVLAALMPKCPLCVAAWLGVLGISGLASSVDLRVLWLAAALALGLVSSTIIHRFQRWKETRS